MIFHSDKTFFMIIFSCRHIVILINCEIYYNTLEGSTFIYNNFTSQYIIQILDISLPVWIKNKSLSCSSSLEIFWRVLRFRNFHMCFVYMYPTFEFNWFNRTIKKRISKENCCNLKKTTLLSKFSQADHPPFHYDVCILTTLSHSYLNLI